MTRLSLGYQPHLGHQPDTPQGSTLSQFVQVDPAGLGPAVAEAVAGPLTGALFAGAVAGAPLAPGTGAAAPFLAGAAAGAALPLGASSSSSSRTDSSIFMSRAWTS